MFSADPQHQYDNYNDATKYRKTGELMEVSFQPLFIEGIPGGSSKYVIIRKPSYPLKDEKIGISVDVDPMTGMVIRRQVLATDNNEKVFQLVGAGEFADASM